MPAFLSVYRKNFRLLLIAMVGESPFYTASSTEHRARRNEEGHVMCVTNNPEIKSST